MDRFFLAIALIAFSLPSFGEPKAYEVVKYRGAANGMTIAFDFADGYSEASELRITAKGHQSVSFSLDEIGETRFVFKNKASGGQKVILRMSPADAAPTKVEGVYHGAKGQTVSFSLTKQ